MSDGEFWDHVFGPGYDMPDVDLGEEVPISAQYDACPECGEMGSCAVDELGRPMVHIIPNDDEAMQ